MNATSTRPRAATGAARTRSRMGTRAAARAARIRIRQTLWTMAGRHFVKFTFLKLDPAWRRRDAADRAQDKREFAAACNDFAEEHFLRTYSLVGTRGDCDLLVRSATPNLDSIHELHVVLNQSGLMRYADIAYSYLAVTKESVYADEPQPLAPRPNDHKYLIVYPMWKKREWYRLSPDERMDIMREHIAVARQFG